MKHYLFVHFRETTSPEGEQVHFALSRDGFAWEALNGGRPILWAYAGDHGVRDMTIVRDGPTIHILATDLSLAYGMRGRYAHSWENIRRHGSRALAHWHSEDLVHWTEEELIPLGGEDFSFPYGFKHGTILPITPEEYERMKAHDWSNVPDNR